MVRSLDPSLEQAAIDAVRNWKFTLGKKKGKPVRVRAAIEVNFRLM